MSPKRTTVIIPALNEAGNLGLVLQAMPAELVDQVIVVDGGSTDGTREIARANGARVITGPRPCAAALNAAGWRKA